MAMEHEHPSPDSATPIRRLSIIGSGLMGAGIAQVAALAGIDVRLHDSQEGAVERAISGIGARIDRLVEKGRVDAEAATAAKARLGSVPTIAEAAADTDAVIEAVIETLEVKQRVFEELAANAGAETLLATNTSALPITAISARSEAPERIVGMHFFSPVPLTRLCEIVRGHRTSDSTVGKALALAAQLEKETIVVQRDDAGFVTSRLMTVLIQEALLIHEAGLATPAEIDRACRLAFGHAMGPFETADLTGVDISLRANTSIFEQSGDPRYAPPQTLKRMVAAGDLGRKTGRGFYDYSEEGAR